MRYLIGPGRSNEHTDPHLVAGDPVLLEWHDDAELGVDAATGIARHLDRPRTAYGVTVPGGHVWHCSLALRAEEGLLTDERWAAIATDFVTAMGFDDPTNQKDPDSMQGAGKAPCRWVAVRHGVSRNGNDHIHVAVNLVREDCTKATTHNDFRRAQTAARALEVKYGLEELEYATAGRATRGSTRAEQARVEVDAERSARRKYETVRGAGTRGHGADGVAPPARHARPRRLLRRNVRTCAPSPPAAAAGDRGHDDCRPRGTC